MTQTEIAKVFGVRQSYVSMALSDRRTSHFSDSLTQKIREYALEHGYVKLPNGYIKRQSDNDYLDNSNFPSKEVRDERMMRLRKQGYTNAEIAEEVGVCVSTVASNIGVEPKEYTEITLRINGEIERIKNKARAERASKWQQILSAKVESKQREIDKLRKQIEMLANEIEEIKAS